MASPERSDWELHFPAAQEVSEYLFKMDYDHPAIFANWIEEQSKESQIGGARMKPFQWKALLKVGLVKPIFVETSDKEAFFTSKYWCGIENEYRRIEQMDPIDIQWFVEQAQYVWSLN